MGLGLVLLGLFLLLAGRRTRRVEADSPPSPALAHIHPAPTMWI